jgi:hypothetical protein
VRVIEFLHGHLEGVFKEFISFNILLFYLVENSIGEVDDPVYGMFVR